MSDLINIGNDGYERICDVIDRVKNDDRQLDTDDYASMILGALNGEPVPAEYDDEDYMQMQSDFESGECAVIYHDGSVTFCRKALGRFNKHFNEHDERMAAIKQAMDEAKFWPNIYSVNDHGNVSLLDNEGHEIKAWV